MSKAARTKNLHAEIDETKILHVEEAITHFQKSLGEGFTYPAYNPEKNTEEEELTAEKIKDMLDISDITDINEYLNEHKSAKNLDLHILDIMNSNLAARLKERLTNIIQVATDDSEGFEANIYLLTILLNHTMVINDQKKDIERRREWGTDNDGIRKLARTLLVLRESIYLPIPTSLSYLSEATKDIPELEKMFDSDISQAFKELNRKIEGDRGYG